MKIRTKLSLWIIGAGVFASLVLSSVVFYGLAVEYYEVLDNDIKSLSSEIVDMSAGAADLHAFIGELDKFPGIKRYWVRLYSADHDILWQTPVAKKINIPIEKAPASFTFSTHLRPREVYPDMRGRGMLTFRVKLRFFQLNGQSYGMLIGKPIDDPGHEIGESMGVITVGFVVAVLALILLSRFFAGRALKPISEIGRITNRINENTLDQRIVLESTRDEFGGLSKALNAMLERLQASFDRQKHLLSDASHELRSPLTLLRLQTEERLQRRDLSEEQEAQLLRQQEALHRMSRLVNSLLDLSALESEGHLEMKEVLLPALVDSVLEDFSELLRARKITAQTKIPAQLRLTCDVEKIRRVIVNLVDNAVKYNHEGGRLAIDAGREASGVHLSVYNTGPGIPGKDLPRIFDQFFRIEPSRSLQYGGSGLGLTIVKSIVCLHGGRVAAKSSFGAWTRIEIHLPINEGMTRANAQED